MMAGLELSTIITIAYASCYTFVFLLTSIYCLWELKQNHQKEQSNTHQGYTNTNILISVFHDYNRYKMREPCFNTHNHLHRQSRN